MHSKHVFLAIRTRSIETTPPQVPSRSLVHQLDRHPERGRRNIVRTQCRPLPLRMAEAVLVFLVPLRQYYCIATVMQCLSCCHHVSMAEVFADLTRSGSGSTGRQTNEQTDESAFLFSVETSPGARRGCSLRCSLDWAFSVFVFAKENLDRKKVLRHTRFKDSWASS